MQTSVQETSTELLLDLVSKFLFKLLGKDDNYAQYLKHWTSFRKVLYNTPFTIDPALSYIATLEIQSSSSSTLARPRPGPLTGVSSPMNVQPLDLSGNVSDMTLENFESSIRALSSRAPHQRTNSSHQGSKTSSPHQGSKTSSPEDKGRMNSYRPSNFRHESIGDSGATTISERFKNAYFPENALNCVSRNASFGNAEGTDSPCDSTNVDMGNLLESFRSTTPYQLGFLTGLSRKLANNIHAHTNNMTRVKEENEIVLEERSPLRRLKVHGKKEDTGNKDLLDRIEKIYQYPTTNININPTNINNNKNIQAPTTYTIKHWIV
jgi:hypothetical protein